MPKTTITLPFYDMMKYPTPAPAAYFSYNKKVPLTQETKTYNHYSDQMKEYCAYTEKHSKLFQRIPGIVSVYVCNSMSFNWLKKHSDIDLICVTRPWMTRIARALTVMIFWIQWLKRHGSSVTKKFCLSYWIDRDHLNLSQERLVWDVYLAHRLRHLVCVYTDTIEQQTQIWKKNTRLKDYFQGPMEQIVSLPLKIHTWHKKIKHVWEKLLQTYIWKNIETIIYSLRKPLMMYKKQKEPERHAWVKIQSWYIKLYYDKRTYINKHYKDFVKKTNSYQI